MKKLLYLAILSLVATLLFAPVALAQEADSGGENPCTANQFEQFIPEVNGCVTTEGQPSPGEVTVFDADTREPIGTLDEVIAEIEAGETPTATGDQYETPATPPTATTATPLPDTGGPALLLPAAAGLFLATGPRRAEGGPPPLISITFWRGEPTPLPSSETMNSRMQAVRVIL